MLFLRSEDHPTELPEATDREHWAALMRGQVMAAIIRKNMDWVILADQKAQAMIILNTILVPVAMNWLHDPAFAGPAAIAIFTAFSSILASIVCIYPKRQKGRKPRGERNLLHFGDIGRLPEARYLDLFNPVFNDMERFAEATIRDLHDVSRHVILPKFFWLKIAYGIFFIGNLAAVVWGMAALWGGEPLASS